VSSTKTGAELLDGMIKSLPVSEPWGRPVYSNIAFTIIAYVIEAATGKNYTEQLRAYITDPFGMASTRPSPGIDEKAVIPPVDNVWGGDYKDQAP